MKKTIINLGGVVATLLMFSPIIIIFLIDKISKPDFYFYLISSILYDIYMYSIIRDKNDIQADKEHYYKYVKDVDKRLHLNLSYEDKFKNLESYIEEYFDKKTK